MTDGDHILDRLTTFLSQGLTFVTDSTNPAVAAWQLSFALGTDNCVGHTMTSKAQELGVTTACLSKGATRVCRMLELPPSPYMLTKAAQIAYRNLRNNQEKIREQNQTQHE